MRRLLIAALLAALPACGGGGPIGTAQAQDLSTTPLPAAKMTVSATSEPGGQRGNVNSSLVTHRVARTDTESFEWGLVSVLDNHAAAGENVAIYGQGNSRNSGPTWAAVFETIQHARNTATLVGVEINLKTLDADTGNRVGLHLVESGVGSTDAIRVSGNWRSLLDVPQTMLRPASGRHVGNLPVTINGRAYFLPVYQ